MLFVRNLIPVAASRIVGLVDIATAADSGWNFMFRRCVWRLDETGERIELFFGVPFEFWANDGPRFQREALEGARELVGKRLLVP
jgi:hypothetical protein